MVHFEGLRGIYSDCVACIMWSMDRTTVPVVVFTLALAVLGLIFLGMPMTLGLGSSDCFPATADFEFTEATHISDMTVRITHTGGDNLPANRTFVRVGSTSRRWMSLQPPDVDTTVEAGDNVTVNMSTGKPLRVVFQRTVCENRNETFGRYNYSDRRTPSEPSTPTHT